MANNVEVIINAKDYASKVLKDLKSNFGNITNQIKDIGAVAGIGFGAMTYGINEVVKKSNEFENAMKGLQSVAEGNNVTFDKAKQVVENFTKDGLVAPAEAATSLKNLLARGFGLDEATVLMDRFKDSASFGRQASLGLGQAIAGATEGLKNNNPLLVDNAGVTKNVSIMWDDYAKKIGTTASKLTDSQKIQAEYNGILQETKNQLGDAQKYSDGFSGAQARLNAEISKTEKEIGDALKPALADILKEVQPVIEAIGKWVAKNPELTKTLILTTTAVLGIITAVSALTVAFGFLAANPVILFITALVGAGVLLYKNWDKIKLNVGGALYFMIKDFKEKFAGIILYFTNFSSNLKSGFNILIKQAKDWGGNMIDMFVDGIKSKIVTVTNAVKGVATTISDFLGFHSPTKQGPGSDSDKWMPNLIKMMAEGLGQTSPIETKVNELAGIIGKGLGKEKMQEIADNIKAIGGIAESAFNGLVFSSSSSKENIIRMKEELKTMQSDFVNLKAKGVDSIKEIGLKFIDLRDKGAEKIKELESSFENLKAKGIETLQGLQNKWDELNQGLNDIGSKGIDSIARRTIDIEIRQTAITKELQNQNLEIEQRLKLQEEQKKLETELQLAKGQVTGSDIEKVKNELAKSETQKILDKIEADKQAQTLKIEALDKEILKQKELQKIDEEKALANIVKETAQNTLELNNLKIKAQEQLAINQKEEADFLLKMNNKRIELNKEFTLYQSLVEQKTTIDNLYFDNFGVRIKAQMDETQKAIILLDSLNSKSGGSKGNTIAGARASGGSVNGGSTYLVGEKGPELFMPKGSGNIIPNNQLGGNAPIININISGVNANSQNDINNLTDTIISKITRQMQLSKLGIS